MSFSAADLALVVDADCADAAAVLLEILRHHFAGRSEPMIWDSRPLCDPLLLREVARLNKVALFMLPCRDALVDLDAGFAGWLDQVRLVTMAMNRRNLWISAQLSDRLTQEGLAHVQFKGPIQQILLYGTPDMKPSGDIDILLHRQDLRLARQVLEDMGYAAQQDSTGDWSLRFLGEQHFLRDARDPVIDLHIRLQQPGSPAPRGIMAVLDRAERIAVGETTVPVMGRIDRCLIAAISLVKAMFGHEPCLGYVMDMRAALDLLLPGEADALMRISRDHRLAETLAVACRAVGLLFPGGRHVGGSATVPLPAVSDADLARMLVTPWDRHLRWPRRREVLWSMCGGRPLRFAGEAVRALSSEGYRRASTRLSYRGEPAR
ncbi:MAG: nucleotidyltransferase family protein [Rhodobacterales bacterium]|nr:nucleotidyltransferase family protein [Rhodobacterales bacterium]